MIVELLGGPFDGDEATLEDEVRRIVLMQPNFAVFVTSEGPLNNLPHGYERIGEYVSTSCTGTPMEFSWEPEE